MSDEIKLTFDADDEINSVLAPKAEAPAKEEQKGGLTEDSLSESERKQVADFAEKINIADSAQVMKFGASAQSKVAAFSDSALAGVRTKDMGEIGEMLTSLVAELRELDPGTPKKGLFGMRRGGLAALKAKYDKAEVNVDKVVTTLEDHQVTLMKDVAVLDKLYEVNLSNVKELAMYILAGRRKLRLVTENELPALEAKAKSSGLAEDAQAYNDMAAYCERFEKKLHDLELTRMVAIQMAPQIRLIQNNDTLMTEKIQSTIVNTIPLWKSQMVIAMGLEHGRQAIAAERAVNDMTNELLRKNAENLRMGTVEVARESERGIIDMETLKHTNEQLIATIDEVRTIQTEGRAKRREAETELAAIEQQLKNKLLEIRDGKQ